MEALKSEWAQAGINVTLDPQNLDGVIQAFKSGTFNAELQQAGSYDPAIGNGVDERYGPEAPFTGTKDPKIGTLETEGVSTLSTSAPRKDLSPALRLPGEGGLFTVPLQPAELQPQCQRVSGPGLTTPQFLVEWQDVART